MFSKNEHGERLQLKPAYSDKEEAMIVTQDIKRIRRQDHCSWSDFAILYRTNSQSRSFEEQMRKDNIPYRIYGGLSFYQRKEIKDVIAYFRLIANPNDEEAFKRLSRRHRPMASVFGRSSRSPYYSRWRSARER